MIRNILTFILLTISLSCFSSEFIKSMFDGDIDPKYCEDLDDYMTIRLYTSEKHSSFAFNDKQSINKLNYSANPTRSIGVGMSYKWLSFNVGYGFAFANKDSDQLGNTERIDLQSQIHTRKLTGTFFASRYKGYYLEDGHKEIQNFPNEINYTRGDISDFTIGGNLSYIVNNKKFSSRAVYTQNEWQKKTAGSLVGGLSIYYRQLSADSSFIPENITDTNFYQGIDFNKITYFAFGQEIGYAINFVVRQHWFINGGIMGGLAIGNSAIWEMDGNKIGKIKINLTLIPTFGFGYNSKRFYTGFNYTSFSSLSPSPIENTSMDFSSGRWNLVFAYRFKMEKFIKLPDWSPLQF